MNMDSEMKKGIDNVLHRILMEWKKVGRIKPKEKNDACD
jgi:hypothetical protein